MLPITNIDFQRTETGWRICGELQIPPVKIGGETVKLPAYPVCVDISKKEAKRVFSDVKDEGKRFFSRVRGWFS